MAPLLDGPALVAQRELTALVQPVQVVTEDGSNPATDYETDQLQGKERQTSDASPILKKNLGDIGQPVSQIVKIAPQRLNGELLEPSRFQQQSQ